MKYTEYNEENPKEKVFHFETESKKLDETTVKQSIGSLQRLRQFDGEPAAFWPLYLASLVSILGTDTGIIAVNTGGRDQKWGLLAVQPDGTRAKAHIGLLQSQLNEIAGTLEDREIGVLSNGDTSIVALRLATGSEKDYCVAAFLVPSSGTQAATEKFSLLRMAADVPVGYQQYRRFSESRSKIDHFSGVLDLMVLLNAEKYFLSAAMVFCNEIASRLKCDRVSLGWLENGYVEVKAISHVDTFERKTEIVQKLEAAMEEVVDQNAPIVLPSADNKLVSREHTAFAAMAHVRHLCSIPMRIEGEPVAVFTCERGTEAFTDVDLRLLQLSGDQSTRLLSDLKKNDRWFGARLAAYFREKAAGVVGFEHTWAKVLAILVATALGIICFGRITYRVEAPVIVRTENVAYVSAPFDGHIEQVSVRVGDTVDQGSELLVFDTSRLLLEKASRAAEKIRYERELTKAQANLSLADMRISEALIEQTSAQISQLDYQLERSTMRAPIPGVVIEGDLTERIGAAVKQGDVLYKVARPESLYAEIEIDEADVHEIQTAITGEVAFLSRPQEVYGIRLTRVEPAAVVKKEGNIYLARAEFTSEGKSWWRPGMTGVAKLNVGKRTILWILVHRTVDFLRLRLWW